MTPGDEPPDSGTPWLDWPTDAQPIPASIFHATVAQLHAEVESLKRELMATHKELAQAREDLRQVLRLLENRGRGWKRLGDAMGRAILHFAEDKHVRWMLVAGFIVGILAWAGVTGLSWQDGTLTISPTPIPPPVMESIQPEPGPMESPAP
jgi:hypothetical protein